MTKGKQNKDQKKISKRGVSAKKVNSGNKKNTAGKVKSINTKAVIKKVIPTQKAKAVSKKAAPVRRSSVKKPALSGKPAIAAGKLKPLPQTKAVIKKNVPTRKAKAVSKKAVPVRKKAVSKPILSGKTKTAAIKKGPLYKTSAVIKKVTPTKKTKSVSRKVTPVHKKANKKPVLPVKIKGLAGKVKPVKSKVVKKGPAVKQKFNTSPVVKAIQSGIKVIRSSRAMKSIAGFDFGKAKQKPDSHEVIKENISIENKETAGKIQPEASTASREEVKTTEKIAVDVPSITDNAETPAETSYEEANRIEAADEITIEAPERADDEDAAFHKIDDVESGVKPDSVEEPEAEFAEEAKYENEDRFEHTPDHEDAVSHENDDVESVAKPDSVEEPEAEFAEETKYENEDHFEHTPDHEDAVSRENYDLESDVQPNSPEESGFTGDEKHDDESHKHIPDHENISVAENDIVEPRDVRDSFEKTSSFSVSLSNNDEIDETDPEDVIEPYDEMIYPGLSRKFEIDESENSASSVKTALMASIIENTKKETVPPAEFLTVPDCMGADLFKTIELLKKMGFECGLILYEESKSEKNRILKQSVSSGKEVPYGTKINFVVSGKNPISYLPSMYQKNDVANNNFLKRYLWIFQTIVNSINTKLDNHYMYYNPLESPDEFFKWVASWFSLNLNYEIEDRRLRLLVKEAVTLYKWRGTAIGIRRFLEIVTGIEPVIYENSTPFSEFVIEGSSLTERHIINKRLTPYSFTVHFPVESRSFNMDTLKLINEIIKNEKPINVDFYITFKPKDVKASTGSSFEIGKEKITS
jgi:phage tail-like protein